MIPLWDKLARRWKRKSHCGIPPGHLVIKVGPDAKRFIIKTSYLNQPVFRQLLELTYEEYGFDCKGPLAIPCEEFLFEEIIRSVRDCHNLRYCCCQNGGKGLRDSFSRDSKPLLA
ncbi:hypothetical protein ACHQM5_009883 [Ranunculus cassubicifolius]